MSENNFLRKFHCSSLIFTAFCIALLCIILGSAMAEAAAAGKSWKVVASVNPQGDDSLFGVAATSTGDVWAVGTANQGSVLPVTLIEHWNGTLWQVVSSPNPGPGNNHLYGVTALSPTNVWAVGYSYNSPVQTLVEHWNGSAWSVVASPSPGTFDNRLVSVAALSPTNIWAVGYYALNDTSSRVLIEHWNGAKWNVFSGLNPGSATTYNRFNSVTAISASDVWAAGNYTNAQGTPETLVEHWNGQRWSLVASPSPGTVNDLYGITAVSATSVWAVGVYQNAQNATQSLIEHWNGSAWQVVASPNPQNGGILNSVAAISASDLWAVGEAGYPSGGGAVGGNVSTNNPVIPTLIEHWNGTNWQIISSPNPGTYNNSLSAVAHVPGSGQLWAVGSYNNGTPPVQTLTALYS